MQRTRTVAALALAFACVAVPAFAKAFAEWDRNGDGYITKDEWKSGGGPTGNFKAQDCNGDNQLSEQEWLRAPHDHAKGPCVQE